MSGVLNEAIEIIQASRLADRDKGTLTRMLRLMQRRAVELSGEELAEVRLNAGLSRGQASKLLRISREDLLMIETCPGDVKLDPLLGRRMDAIYGIDVKDPPEVQP